MKLKYVFGILASIFILTNIASAAIDSQYIGKTYVLDHDSESPAGVQMQTVTVTILNSNTLQFKVVRTSDSYPSGYFAIVGLPTTMHIPTEDGNPTEPEEYSVMNEAGKVPDTDVSYAEGIKLDGFKEKGNFIRFNGAIFEPSEQTEDTQNDYKTITVTLTDDSTFDPDISINNYFGAHVKWENKDYPSVSIDSAFFMGKAPKEPEPPEPPTQVPEFPSVALPIASIIGILFIFGSRKQE